MIQEINDLENFPFFTTPHDLAKLKGRKGYYRIRIGDLRIIFKVDKEPKKYTSRKSDTERKYTRRKILTNRTNKLLNIYCDRRITDSLIGQNVTILNHENNLPRGHRLILGDMSKVTL